MPTVFSFDAYTWDAKSGRADFLYSVTPGDQWVETLTFPPPRVAVPFGLWNRVLFSLHIMLGIGYWKTSCPKNIQIRSGELSRAQATFWNAVYQKGLGEFFYRNHLLGNVHVRFPYLQTSSKSIRMRTTNRSLVQLGGGKDSLTSIALLQKMKKPIETFCLGSYPLIKQQTRALHLPHHTVQRTLDPKLLKGGKRYRYNGHIPIAAIYAWVGLALAVRSGDRWIVASNERSANIGNITYHGIRVNHQWSKSLEFERLFSEYVQRFVTPDVRYFSLLRPLFELNIARLFIEHYPQPPIFSSCNKNFLIRGWNGPRWCGTCAKCAFVFLMLAPFFPKDRLQKFFGANLLNQPSLIPMYKQLLGIRDHKPFDCVGVPTEVRAAFGKMKRDGSYASDAVMRALDPYLTREGFRFSQDWKRAMHVSTRYRIPRFFQSFLHDLR